MRRWRALSELPKRRHARLGGYDYAQAGYYAVTVCVQDKLPVLSNINVGQGLVPAEVAFTPTGRIVEEEPLALAERYPHVRIDKYVIMPTHVHAIIVIMERAMDDVGRGLAPAEDDEIQSSGGGKPPPYPGSSPTLMQIVGTFKSFSTRLCNQHDALTGRRLWQTSFYDEIIRNEAAYRQIWQYIDGNPAKWNEDEYYA